MSDPLADIRNLRRISPELVTSGQPGEAHFATIAAEGFEVVINLGLHGNPGYSLEDEPGTVQSLGMEYIHIPVQWEAPSPQDLSAFCSAMNRCQGRRIWVHCAANMRVTAFVGLYRANVLGWERSEAFALMESVWSPNPLWARFIEENLGDSRLRNLP